MKENQRYDQKIFLVFFFKKTYTAKNADKIVVLDGGTIIAYDTHENLLANCEIYQDIYNSQLKREGDING